MVEREKRGAIPTHYNDTGCSVSSSCFTCPLPECRYDNPTSYNNWMRRQRRAQVRALVTTHGEKPFLAAELSSSLGVGERQAYRIKAQVLKGGSGR